MQMLHQVKQKIHRITSKTVFSVRWIRFVVKQRVIDYVRGSKEQYQLVEKAANCTVYDV